MLLFLLLLSGLFSEVFASSSGHGVILQYHRFDESKYKSTNVSMEKFKRHMNYLLDNNYTIIPLSSMVKLLQEKKPLPHKAVAITMDDAYKSIYTEAFGFLKEHSIPFTVFVNSQFVNRKSKRYLSWEDMRVMGKSGAEFANHTYAHIHLPRVERDDYKKWKKIASEDIVKCQKDLEKNLSKDILTAQKILVYPYGEYDKRVLKLVAELGYIGIAQVSGPVDVNSNLLTLHRFPMSGNYGSVSDFRLKVNTVPLPVTYKSSEETIVSKENNPPSLTIGLKKKFHDLQCFNSSGKKIAMQYKSPLSVEMKSEEPLNYPRDRYTCTAKTESGKWYWFSHLWVILKEK